MYKENIKIRKYPVPNKNVPGSSSQFAVAVKTVTENGKEITKDVLKAVEPMLPVCSFTYAPHGGSKFEVKKENGADVTQKGKKLMPYLPGKELIELVRLAQILQRPILIKGEPGSGKTQLAKSVAYEWYGNDYKQHFFEWQVKSTSKAVDGLYTFDHIHRLRNANFSKKKVKVNEKGEEEKEDMTQYRQFGPMGMAFVTSRADSPSILLIDEIDKADIDFPNDLLRELDEQWFSIPPSETGEVIEAPYPPLIFITSNDEREMPEAFLRRCLFLYIKFPDDDRLVDIIEAHIPGITTEYAGFTTKAIERFNHLRKEIESDPGDKKHVSTSELLDWLGAYYYELKNGNEKVIDDDLANLPHFFQALLKTDRAVNRRLQGIESNPNTSENKPTLTR